MPATEETPALLDARRAMEVCNACRYCEGFCAVFPAMELRREYSQGDLNYLANLCHGCKGCYYACQYAPPHEFGINLPATLARVRHESYAQHAWPEGVAALYRRNGMVMATAMAAGIAVILLLAMAFHGRFFFAAQDLSPGRGFFDVIPYGAMVWVASVTFLFALLALGIGFARFWREMGGTFAELTRADALKQALHDAARLTYLGGGGQGCNDKDGRFGFGKRHLHHAMAYGFLLCFAATAVATIYHHVFGWISPYRFFSLPVLLGTAGGIGLMTGTAGLLWMKLTGDQEPQARELTGTDSALLLLLFLLGFTGLALLALRATGAMGTMLAIHLGLVLAFFLTIPYSKFVHGPYRLAALIRHALERPGAH